MATTRPSWAISRRSAQLTPRIPVRPEKSIRPLPPETTTTVPWRKSISTGNFALRKPTLYTGDNGRAAILNNSLGANLFYMAGNAGNGTQVPQPVGVIISTGAQMMIPEVKAEVAQNFGTPTAVGSFNIAQLGDSLDKIGKDTNFRGLTIFNDVLYYTKGSGGNGINTVYFVDTTGSVCTDTNGVGLPVSGASLPTSPLAYTPAQLSFKPTASNPTICAS